jgi:hypothetical protein
VAAATAFVVLHARGVAAQQSALVVLPENPPEVVLYRLGSVLVNPRITIPEVGYDSNAFNEPTDAKDDFVIKMIPEIDFFGDISVLRVVVRAATALTYYHDFESERSVAGQVRGRVTARFSRLRPWAGGASVRSNERTTEIDARALRTDNEVAAGLQFDITPVASLLVSGSRTAVEFSSVAAYEDVYLGPALDRTNQMVFASLRLQATPFTSVTFNGYVGRDDFAYALTRDADLAGGDVEFNFSPEAIIRGRVVIGFRQQRFNDPTLETYRGVIGRGGFTTLLGWHAMLGVDYIRDVQYSYSRRDGYYVENGVDVVYTQRIGGPFDFQMRAGRRGLDYSARVGVPEHSELLRTYQAGVGYSLESGSRFGLSYEFGQRTGGIEDDRRFSRRRLFGSFTYEFWK